MPPTPTGQIGAGTIVQAGNGASPEVFTAIQRVQTIPNVGAQRDTVESTTLQSTARDYIGGLPDGSSPTLAVNFIPDEPTHEALIADYATGVVRNFKEIFIGGTILSFSAVVVGQEVSGGPNDIVVITFTLKITGPIVWS